jgi:polar amino acid transport system substrate-binding protein
MALALAACGSSGGNPSNGQNDAQNASQNTGDSQDAPGGDVDINTLVVESGKLHMSTNASFPPYEMVANDGSFEGIDVEVAGLIAEKLGLELVVDDMDFTAAMLAVQNGKSDIAMAGITVNEERQANMDFTESYATGVQVIIVPGGSSIATVDDLANAELIGTQDGTTGYIYCSDTPENGGYGEDHVVAYENGSVAIQALLAGQVDCVVIDNEPAKAYVAANPGLKILDTEFTVEDYAIAMKKGSTELMDLVNTALKELMDDGSVQAVVDKYIKA